MVVFQTLVCLSCFFLSFHKARSVAGEAHVARNVAFCLETSETEKDLGLMAVRKHVLQPCTLGSEPLQLKLERMLQPCTTPSAALITGSFYSARCGFQLTEMVGSEHR